MKKRKNLFFYEMTNMIIILLTIEWLRMMWSISVPEDAVIVESQVSSSSQQAAIHITYINHPLSVTCNIVAITSSI